MEQISPNCHAFSSLARNPVVFLNNDNKSSQLFADISASLYCVSKVFSQSPCDDPFGKLHVEGFDDEQIWQQIDAFNSQSIKTCTKGAALCLNTSVKIHAKLNNERGNVTSDFEQDDDSTSEEEEERIKKSDQNSKHENDEKTKVDDDFFSLRQMEKFLLSQESIPANTDSNDEIDYFDEIPSDSDGGDDFNGHIFGDDDEVEHITGGYVSEVDSDKNSPEIKRSARSIKYNQFFLNEAADNILKHNMMSKFEKQQTAMSKKIEALEEEALGEKEWQMQGEMVASNRPVNSLLEEVLSFEHSQRPAPEITDEHTCNLEKIICQRIKDKSWDDVERKIKEVKDPHEYKRTVVLESEKSKMSLQEIYEKEYLAKLMQEREEAAENPAHVELATLMKDLFKKLDALSNFHFRLPPPEPEIKVLANLPSIAMEEVQPITHTEADTLAPEEIHFKKEEKGSLEKSSTDKKRERRKKATRQKVCFFLLVPYQ